MTTTSQISASKTRSRAARFLARFFANPGAAMAELHQRLELALIRRDGVRSLRRTNIPHAPYDDVARAVMDVHWFHRITLPDGRVTPGDSNTPAYARRLRLPELSGKTVLDVGAWDGFYSFEAEKRGARRVLATDHFCWSGEGWGTRAGFDLAHRLLRSKVEARDIDIADISPDTVGMFDVVLFLGVVYHLEEPLAALRRVASVTSELLILETMVDLTFLRQPALSFQRGRTQPRAIYRHWRRDATTWFGPNEAAVIAMLEQAGFSRVERVFPRFSLSRPLVHFMNAFVPFVTIQKNYRMVFHAWK